MLQTLIDRGYAGAEVDEDEPVENVLNLPDGIEPWDVSVFHTATGYREIAAIERGMEKNEDNSTADFVRRYIGEVSRTLSFQPVIPAYLLAKSELLAIVDMFADENALRLTYDRGVNTVTTITFDQGPKQLPRLSVTGHRLAQTSKVVSGTPVSIRQYQVSTVWARIITQWDENGVHLRLTLDQKHMFDPDYEAEPQPLIIDNKMRNDVLRLARSIIKQT